MIPMTAMRMAAGIMADGAFPNVATPEKRTKRNKMLVSKNAFPPCCFLVPIRCHDLPAGNERTPAPTMLLMRLKTSALMVAVPPDSLAPPRGSGTAAAASFPNRVEEDLTAVVVVVKDREGVSRASEELMPTATTAAKRRQQRDFIVCNFKSATSWIYER